MNTVKHQQYLAQLPKLPQAAGDIPIIYCPSVFRNKLLELIASATRRIYLVALYLENDDAGRDVLSALYRAKQQHVTLAPCSAGSYRPGCC